MKWVILMDAAKLKKNELRKKVCCRSMDENLLRWHAVLAAFILILSPILMGCSEISPDIENVVRTQDNHYTCGYDGADHDFILDLPETAEGSPLILMLHGYGQTAESFRLQTGFEKDANQLGYAVAYVTGAPNPNDRTSATGWNSGIADSPNRDVEFLSALAIWLQREYRLDSERVFAVGFSNGAFMSHRLALEANDTFSAVVSVAGMMPESVWSSRPSSCQVSLLQITGEKDDVIPKNSDGSARYSKAPAIEDVVAYYAEANGLCLVETNSVGKASFMTVYRDDHSDRQVWHLIVKGGHHSWSAENITGINTNQLILQFLETQ